MGYSTLLFEQHDGLATIALHRPDAANAMDIEMARDLMRVAIQCDDQSVRAVLISGSGRWFCPGGDLKSFASQAGNLPAHLKEMTTYLHAAISRFRRMDAPVVVAVHGVAAGAGMSLAMAGDILLAAESARFVVAYTGIGLSPDGSSTYMLPRLVGLRRALELTLTNRTLTAQEAFDWGIVSRIVPDDAIQAEARSLAETLAAGPTRALGMAKRLLQDGWNETLETQMENEAQGIAAMARTLDAREGIQAFMEKRTPKFSGR